MTQTQAITFRHTDLIGATDIDIFSDNRVAIASPVSGRVTRLRFDTELNEVVVDNQTAELDPPPVGVKQWNDDVFVLGGWTRSANGKLSRYLIENMKTAIVEAEDDEMAGPLELSEDLNVIFHTRTRRTPMLVARDPETLEVLDTIVLSKKPLSFVIDQIDNTLIYVLNQDDTVVIGVRWNATTESLAIESYFMLPHAFKVQEIVAVNGVFYYTTATHFCFFDVETKETIFQYHDDLQQFSSVQTIGSLDDTDLSEDYLFNIDKARRSVDRSRAFRDPNLHRHFFGRFQQLVGSRQAPFLQITNARPQPLLRRLESRTFSVDAETGIVTWSAPCAFRFRGWASVSGSQNQPDDDVTVVAGELVSYDTQQGARLQTVGTPLWSIDPTITEIQQRVAAFDGETAMFLDSVLSGAIGDTFTLLAWVRPDPQGGTSTDMTVVAGQGAFPIGYELRITGDTSDPVLLLRVNNQDYADEDVPGLYDGAWHQIGATYDGSDTRLYYDGNLIATVATPVEAPSPVLAAFFVGLIADIQAYADVRLTAYIADLFAKGPRG